MKRSTEKNLYEWGDSSPSNVQLGRSSYLSYGSYSGASYGSPVGLVRDEMKISHEASYSLKSPPALTSHANAFNVILNKTKYAFISISWWIYLITCYSLLLDTCVLQSKGAVLLRNFCRKYSNRKLGSCLLLFLLLPVCLKATGGYEYFALHGLNSTFTQTNPSHATLPNHDEPVGKYPKGILPGSTERSEDFFLEPNLRKDVAEKLKSVNEEIEDLKTKFAVYGGTIEKLLKDLDLKIQEKLALPEGASLPAAMLEVNKKLHSRLDDIDAGNAENKKQQLAKLDSLHQLMDVADRKLIELELWRSEADERLAHLNRTVTVLQQQSGDIKKEILPILMSKLEEKIAVAEQNIITYMKGKVVSEVLEQTKAEVQPHKGVDLVEVKKMIDSAIALYDADKIGIPDYALESSGGIVLNTRCTEAFNGHRPRMSILGVPLWSEPNNPRVVIQPGIAPGHCWSFKGFDGYLVIQLSRRIIPTSFSLEHIPISLAPDGNIASAPRNFTVFGLSNESDFDGVKLGEYYYNNGGTPLQTFAVQAEEPQSFSIVELRIHSNHGNPDYTCLYRFRVHGSVAN